jgi:hypothetical protein
MAFFYHSGEEIKPGDRVSLHGEPAEIEFVADPCTIQLTGMSRNSEEA